MRLRKVQGKLKVEHSILDGLRSFLERLLDNNPGAIRSIIPGVIRPVRDAKGEVKYPNVNSLVEISDFRDAQGSYEANIQVISSTRRMLQRTLDILKA